MTSEGLVEVFEGDSADMCAGKFPLVSMGGRANGQACADGERGPPSAQAEIFASTVRFIVFKTSGVSKQKKENPFEMLEPRYRKMYGISQPNYY